MISNGTRRVGHSTSLNVACTIPSVKNLVNNFFLFRGTINQMCACTRAEPLVFVLNSNGTLLVCCARCNFYCSFPPTITATCFFFLPRAHSHCIFISARLIGTFSFGSFLFFGRRRDLQARLIRSFLWRIYLGRQCSQRFPRAHNPPSHRRQGRSCICVLVNLHSFGLLITAHLSQADASCHRYGLAARSHTQSGKVENVREVPDSSCLTTHPRLVSCYFSILQLRVLHITMFRLQYHHPVSLSVIDSFNH